MTVVTYAGHVLVWRIIDSLIPPGAADALRERPYVDELLERHGGAVPLSSKEACA